MTEGERIRVTQRRRPKKGPLLDTNEPAVRDETRAAVEPPPPETEKQQPGEAATQPAEETYEPKEHVTGPIIDTSESIIDVQRDEAPAEKAGNAANTEAVIEPSQTASVEDTGSGQDQNVTEFRTVTGIEESGISGKGEEVAEVEPGFQERRSRSISVTKKGKKRKDATADTMVVQKSTEKQISARGKFSKRRTEMEQISALNASNIGAVSRVKIKAPTQRVQSFFRKSNKEELDEMQVLLKTFKQSSALVRVSLKFFRGFLSGRVDKYEKLEENLKKSKMPYSSIQYLSTVYFVSTVVSIAIGVFVIVFAALLGPFWILPVMFGAVSILGFAGVYMSRPSSLAKKRKKDIDAKIPMAIGYIATMASADMPIDNILFELGESKEYGEIAKEAKSISMGSRFFGRDIISAMREGAKYSPSPKFSEFLQGIVTTVTSGGNLKVYFKSKAVQYQNELSTVIRTNAESIGILAESYVTVGVAFPLMLIVILGVVASLSAGSGGMIIVLYLIDLMIIPLITVAFAFLISSTIKEVNL